MLPATRIMLLRQSYDAKSYNESEVKECAYVYLKE